MVIRRMATRATLCHLPSATSAMIRASVVSAVARSPRDYGRGPMERSGLERGAPGGRGFRSAPKGSGSGEDRPWRDTFSMSRAAGRAAQRRALYDLAPRRRAPNRGRQGILPHPQHFHRRSHRAGLFPHAVGSRAGIELRPGQQVTGTVAWARGADFGLEFDDPIDIAEMLTPCIEGAGSTLCHRPRMPAIEIDCFAGLRLGARTYRTRTSQISQGGVKLRVDAPLAEGEVVVRLCGLPPLSGALRWCDGAVAEIAFNQAIPLGELVPWLKEQQRRSASASRPEAGAPAEARVQHRS